MSSDDQLVSTSDYILSIVPPRDALETAKRVLQSNMSKRSKPLYYLDLNAIAPESAREIGELFKPAGDKIRFIDGGIIGGPPKPKDGSQAPDTPEKWQRPSIPVSGPYPLDGAEPSGAHLSSVLNSKHISTEIGSASGLKMCFASLTKGFTALAIQSFTTAHRLDVLPELQRHLQQYSPSSLEIASRSLATMPPKAYRWVREMEEISKTFSEDGGFGPEETIFRGVAGTYDLVANGTELGNEQTGDRKRGKSAEDVATLMSEGIERRKQKTD